MTGCEILRAAQQLHYVYEGEPPQVNDYCLPFSNFLPSSSEGTHSALPLPRSRWPGNSRTAVARRPVVIVKGDGCLHNLRATLYRNQPNA